MTRWKQLRYRLEEAGCKLLAFVVPKLSRKTCARLARAIGAIAYKLDARGRAIALANIECAFGDEFSMERRHEIALGSYRNFARTMLDLFWAPGLTPENFRKWIHVDGIDPLRERIESGGGGLVFVCGHFGNWEWSNLAAGFLGVKPVTVAENFKNPRLTAIFKALRERSGATLIPQENSVLRMLKAVKRGGPASLVIDLTLPPSQASTIIETFRDPKTGERLKMCVPFLHAVLAQRGGAILVPAEAISQPDGSCSAIAQAPVAVQPGDTLQQIAQRCWDAFEPTVRKHPELYLWAYKHFRYRPRQRGRDYPFYSKESGRFEALLVSGPSR